MRNPIHNAVVGITKRDLVTCKRCGCPDLAWVTYKSGKKGLVETASRRPLWRGDGPAPEGLYALKFNYHRCETYTAMKTELERRASLCHPKADNPAEIVSDALSVLIHEVAGRNDFSLLSNQEHPIGQAAAILLKAMSNIPNLRGVK